MSIEDNKAVQEILRRLDELNLQESADIRAYLMAKIRAAGETHTAAEPAMYRKPGAGIEVWDGEGDPPAWFDAGRAADLLNPAWVEWRDERAGGPPKYVDPSNPRNVWDGRRYGGRVPERAKWIRQYAEEGWDSLLNSRWLAQQSEQRRRPVKFRDPEHMTVVWSGVGKKPRWVIAREEEGYTLEDLRVDAGEAR